MAYDEALAQRLQEALASHPGITERKMFGGLSFMLGGNMCCGVEEANLVVRVGPTPKKMPLPTLTPVQ